MKEYYLTDREILDLNRLSETLGGLIDLNQGRFNPTLIGEEGVMLHRFKSDYPDSSSRKDVSLEPNRNSSVSLQETSDRANRDTIIKRLEELSALNEECLRNYEEDLRVIAPLVVAYYEWISDNGGRSPEDLLKEKLSRTQRRLLKARIDDILVIYGITAPLREAK